MSDVFESKRVEKGGHTFLVEFCYDQDTNRPWEQSDGHGPVRELHKSRDTGYLDKRPGERILNRNPDDREYIWAYDWAAALKLAKKDGWGLNPEEKAKLVQRLGREPTDAELREAAVQCDFKFLAGWVNDEWHYMGVVVTLLKHDPDLEDEWAKTKKSESLWCVESEGDYKDEVANELIDQLLPEPVQPNQGT